MPPMMTTGARSAQRDSQMVRSVRATEKGSESDSTVMKRDKMVAQHMSMKPSRMPGRKPAMNRRVTD